MKSSLKERLRAIALASSTRRMARESTSMGAAERTRLLHKVAAKTLVFTIASGRSGTQTLARIFEAFPQIEATHEGIPAFQDVMRHALSEPSLARDFLLTRKLPAIAASPRPVYLETSHVFGKGFLTPMLRLGLRPRLLFLKRDPRKIALSLERIGATPHRTPGGRAHFLSPADPSLLPVQLWDDFSDYQLCYWYALETIRRQQIEYELAIRAGCNCRFLRIEDLRTPDDVWELLAAMGLDLPRTAQVEAAVQARVGRAFNLKQNKPAIRHASAELQAQERSVIERIQHCLPELDIRQMLAAYLGAGEAPEPGRRLEPMRMSA